MTYELNPSAALYRARREFTHYELMKVHDPSGSPEYIAVLKSNALHTGHAVLVCAGDVDELGAVLRAQGPPRLPRRSEHRAR
ncbi:hypothetical protein [Nocardiopsis lambiniae]|uniref:Uncharacterized protein n=1 Tax=Nocardiopsis lambiniae TaxID=3075539 RepID=A0ABU2MFW7_9ACTN|nr:hypothetical protein [Nocardiopsis sp. DSM 44743]MDT0330965.1 hypothetical protein [Nocardiopsis sp. DSM 44743]